MIDLKDDKDNFEFGVVLSRLGLLTTLSVMSYVNADVSFICDKPREFVSESLLVEGTSFLAASMLD